MVVRTHQYGVTVTWTGNLGAGTTSYRSYERSHEVSAAGKPVIAGSADPTFRGDPTRYNPEELLVASLSQCHLLWYLHLCAVAGVVVVSYTDQAEGAMTEEGNAGGRFTEVVLHPHVLVADAAMVARAEELHHAAHDACYIANSVNFPVRCEPVVATATAPA